MDFTDTPHSILSKSLAGFPITCVVAKVSDEKGIVGWLYWGLTAKFISWRSVTHMSFLAFPHQYYHNFLSKATNFFSHMLQQR